MTCNQKLKTCSSKATPKRSVVSLITIGCTGAAVVSFFVCLQVFRRRPVNRTVIQLKSMHPTRENPPDDCRIEGRVFRDTLSEMLRTFFSEVKIQTGSYCYRGILWHAYSYGFQTALDRADSKSAFGACTDTELCVYDEDLDMLWICPRAIAISCTHPCNDTYIFPATCDWLYITTHENANGIGPYFIRNPCPAISDG